MGTWKMEVENAAEKQNLLRLKEECLSKNRQETTQKTKTKYLESILAEPEFKRAPAPFIMKNQTMVYTRAFIMGRAGMLQCANNFANKYGGKMCRDCNCVDNEDHRINSCLKWTGRNYSERDDKIIFDDIYSNDVEKCLTVVKSIVHLWDLENNKNEMRDFSST